MPVYVDDHEAKTMIFIDHKEQHKKMNEINCTTPV